MMTSPPRYTHTAALLHWLIAFLMVGTLALGLYRVDLPLSPNKLKLYSWHKWAGMTVLAFVIDDIHVNFHLLAQPYCVNTMRCPPRRRSF